MSVKRIPFGRMPDGKTVDRYELKNGDLTVSVLTYGATLQAAVYRGVDVVLGYDDWESYLRCRCSFGSTVGRVANRLKGNVIPIAGKDYTLAANDRGKNHIHGGKCGFAYRLWTARVLENEEAAVTLRRTSPDGEEGYPGDLSVSVTFAVTGDSRLRITYRAVSTADTLLNLTNHAYFNLEGHDGPNVGNHLLQMDATELTVSDAELIPTGELMAVEETHRAGYQRAASATPKRQRLRPQFRAGYRRCVPPCRYGRSPRFRHTDGMLDRSTGRAVVHRQFPE